MSFDQHIQVRLRALETAGILRTPRLVQGSQGAVIRIDGREVISLCSNNYLGLATHPALVTAIEDSTRAFGFGACASRHITGTMSAHRALEERLAHYLGLPRALFFATGYAANLGTIQALSSPETLVLSDELNHASLIDGCRLGRGTVRVFPHKDVDALRQLLSAERHRFQAALVVSESLFSMDGDIAPLAELRAVASEFDAGLLVDDAHAIGTHGPGGRGLCAELGIVPDVLTGTFGKAFGASGAFVLGRAPTVHLIENRARSFVFSTAPSPAIAAAALAAIDLVETADQPRRQLRSHAQTLRHGLRDLGYRVLTGDSHIIPVLLGTPQSASELSSRLLELSVFVHAIRPPTVPAGTSRLRVTPIATHTSKQIENALQAFRDAR